MENTEKPLKQTTASEMKKLPFVRFVTGNMNKLKEFRAISAGVLECDNIKLDLPEYQGTAEEVSAEKCKTAFEQLKEPVLVEDTSLCFNAYGGLPGVYIKWFLKSLGTENLHKMLDGFEDKSGYAQCIFAYMEKEGQEPILFKGRTEGTIVPMRGEKAFGWDPNFQPDGFDKTYAELSAEEKNSISHRGRAVQKLLEYFKDRAAKEAEGN